MKNTNNTNKEENDNMIKYKITTQMENGEIIILNEKFKGDKQVKKYIKESVEPYAYVISIEEQGEIK